MEVRPITFREMCAFVAEHHRHNKPPRGHKFSVQVVDDAGSTLGVASAGRPVARSFDDGLTIEVNRTCTTGARNANSMLYGAVWRAAKAMGYTRAVTYTQADESGASLRGAGWLLVKELSPRANWAQSSKKLAHLRDSEEPSGVPRRLWEIRSIAAPRPPAPDQPEEAF